MESQSSILLRRLNHYCAKALEGAASLCQTRAHAEITPEHWLLKLLEQGQGDLTVLARRYEWDMDAVWQSLLSWLDAQPRSVRTGLTFSLRSRVGDVCQHKEQRCQRQLFKRHDA